MLLHFDNDNSKLRDQNQDCVDILLQLPIDDAKPSTSLSKFVGITCTNKTIVLGTAIVRVFYDTGITNESHFIRWKFASFSYNYRVNYSSRFEEK